jgi:hypothetical protein
LVEKRERKSLLVGAISAPLFSLSMIFSALPSRAEAGVAKAGTKAGNHQFQCIPEKSARSSRRADSPYAFPAWFIVREEAEAGA